MKKQLLLLACLVGMLSCQNEAGNDTVYSDEKERDSIHETTKSEVKINPLPVFKAYLKGLNILKAESNTQALQKFSELFSNESPQRCDSAYLLYHDFYIQLGANLDQDLETDTTDYTVLFYSDENGPATVPKKVKEKAAFLKKHGFEFEATEGFVFIQPDRDYLQSYFKPLVSDAMKAYLDELNLENNRRFSEDAAIIISEKDFVERIQFYEQFIQKYPNFPFIKDCKSSKADYLKWMLIGMDNTPLYRDGNQTLDPYFRSCFDYFYQKYPNSKTTKIIREYDQCIREKNLQKTEKLLKKYEKQQLISEVYY